MVTVVKTNLEIYYVDSDDLLLVVQQVSEILADDEVMESSDVIPGMVFNLPEDAA